MPIPGALTTTEYWTVTDWPVTDGSGVSDVIVVVVVAAVTIWVSTGDVEPVKSPAASVKTAVIEWVPTDRLAGCTEP